VDIARLNWILLSILLLGGLLLSVAMGLMVPKSTLEPLIREHGPVEMTSAVLHFVVVVCLLGLWLRVRRPFGVLAFFAALLGLRELGMHDSVTTDSITRSDYYLEGHVPLPERLLVGVIVIGFLVLTVRLVRAYWQPFVASLRERRPAAVSLAVGLALLPILKVIDALPRLLRDHLDYVVPPRLDLLLMSVEETMEMFLPLIFLAAALSFYLTYQATGAAKRT
jgi:hypothetical protein